MFELARPEYLYIGLSAILPIIFAPKFRRKSFSIPSFYPKRLNLRSKAAAATTLILILSVSFLIALSFAEPQAITKRTVPLEESGNLVMVLIDVSGSMRPHNRTREIFEEIISQDLGALIGLSLYSTENYIARHFSPKALFLKGVLDNVKEIEEISSDTMTAEALLMVNRFFNLTSLSDQQKKSIVLISDLQDNHKEIAKAIKAIVKNGINVYIIVVSDTEKSANEKMFNFQNILGSLPVQMAWSENQRELSRIYQAIKDKETILVGEEEIINRISLAPDFLLPLLGLAVLAIVASETKLRKVK